MKAKLIKHIKIKEDGGNIIEIKLWQVPVSADKPHGYKYSLRRLIDDFVKDINIYKNQKKR